MGSKKSQSYCTARETFSANLRKLRLAGGFTQEVFADKCGLHRNYIGSVERGERNISIDNMELIAKALSCSIEDMLKEVNHSS